MNDIGFIKLSKGAGFAIVDAWLVPHLAPFKWWLSDKGYAVHTNSERGRQQTVRCWMHRVINCTPDGMDTDHKDGIRLDNRSSNLRSVTYAQNAQNRNRNRLGNKTSTYKGVYRHRCSWVALIGVRSKRIHLGSFATEEAAARAYDEAALLHYGAFSKLNFPK